MPACCGNGKSPRLLLGLVAAFLLVLQWTASGAGLESSFVAKPGPAELLLGNGRELAARINSGGVFLANSRGELLIEGQRRAYEVVAAGIVASSPEKTALIDRGLSALEWGFSQAGPDGSFPTERGGNSIRSNLLFPKAMFLEAAARTLLLIQQSDVEPRVKARATALVTPLLKSATWVAYSPDLTNFFNTTKVTNQLLFVALALQETGVVAGDSKLTEIATGLVEQILARQMPDGTFPEKEGFDTNYQSVSLELLARYASLIPDSAWRQTVLSSLRNGVNRLLLVINPSGVVDTSSNTRTIACGSPKSGPGAKGLHADSLPLRLYYVSAVVNDTSLSGLASTLQTRGQRFSKLEKCPATRPH